MTDPSVIVLRPTFRALSKLLAKPSRQYRSAHRHDSARITPAYY